MKKIAENAPLHGPSAVNGFSGEFTLAHLEQACPGVSRDMDRRVLRNLQNRDASNAWAEVPALFGGKRVLPLKEGKRKGNKTPFHIQ